MGEKVGGRSNGEGSIAKRKDGRWHAAYTVGGKRHYMYGRTRKEVATKLKEDLAGSDGVYYPDPEVKDYLTRWLEDSVKRSVRARTHERYESPSAGSTSSPTSETRGWQTSRRWVSSLFIEKGWCRAVPQEPSSTYTLPCTRPSSRPSGVGWYPGTWPKPPFPPGCRSRRSRSSPPPRRRSS